MAYIYNFKVRRTIVIKLRSEVDWSMSWVIGSTSKSMVEPQGQIRKEEKNV